MKIKITIRFVLLLGILMSMATGLGRSGVVDETSSMLCEAVGQDQLPVKAEETAMMIGTKPIAYSGEGALGRGYRAYPLQAKSQNMALLSIEPEQQRVVVGNTSKFIAALQYMGQSWSKPSLAYVNWQGQVRLVLLVGGGYDATAAVNCRDVRFQNRGYDCPNYDPNLALGAGIYMFDAQNGDLLWWASARASSRLGAVQATQHTDLKYSVVSQINTVDRDADGLVDALYFADLGGQVFRVDLDNQAQVSQPLVKRIVRLLDLHQAQGLSPRFYRMPSVSVHMQADQQQLYASVALYSGHSSLLGEEIEKSTGQNGLFVIYDHDVARTDLERTEQLYTANLNWNKLTLWEQALKSSHIERSQSIGGWWYPYRSFTQQTRKANGLGEVVVIDGVLHARVHLQAEQPQINRQSSTIVKGCQNPTTVGQTYLYRLCLPDQPCPSSMPRELPIQRILLGNGMIFNTFSLTSRQGAWADLLSHSAYLPVKACQNSTLGRSQCVNVEMRLRRLGWFETQLK